MSLMKRWPAHRLGFFIFSLALSVGAILGGAASLGWLPIEGNSQPMILSAGRIALAGLFLLLALAGLFICLQVMRSTSLSDGLRDRLLEGSGFRRSFWILVSLLLLAGLLACLPGYRLSASLAAYLLRLRPLLLWLNELGAGGLLMLLFFGSDPEKKSEPLAGRVVRISSMLLQCAFLTVALFIWFSGLGLSRREDYWYGAGVPALAFQVVLAMLAGLLAAKLERFSHKIARWDLLWFLLAWGVSAWLWAREPLHTSFFMAGPFRPTHDFYPFSDAMLFDMGGQSALIGQGIYNGLIFDRVLYMVWSFYLHALAGQNFIKVMAVQAAAFAVLPGILYLLGRELHSRALGVSTATLAALRGVNSIAAATWIDLANPKMALTDFPTAIGVALFTLLIIRWLKKPDQYWSNALWAGAVLGLTTMLRVHVLLLLPAAVFLSLLVYRARWRPWLLGVLLVVIGMFAVTLPWDLRNQSKGAPPFSMYFYRIELILKERYHWPPGSTELLESEGVPVLFQSGAARLTSMTRPPSLFKPQAAACRSQACRIVNHLLHGVTTSVLYLPGSLMLDDLRYAVKEARPYWQQEWRGEGVSLGAGLMLLLNLALIAFGISLAYQAARWAGWVPLGMYMAYLLSDALAFTSGGRYIVPADWVVSIYYLLGLLQLIVWAARRLGMNWQLSLPQEPLPPMADKPLRMPFVSLAVALVFVLAIGSLLPLSEYIFPRRYSSNPKPANAMAWIGQHGLLDQRYYALEKSGLSDTDIKSFLSQPGAGVWQGRMLYPRFYMTGQGEPAGDMPYDARSFPRMAFTLLSPSGQIGVILPGEVRGRFDNATDAVVLGCDRQQSGGKRTRQVDALVVFMVQDPKVAYLRSPMPALKCPMPEPVCLTKDTCK